MQRFSLRAALALALAGTLAACEVSERITPTGTLAVPLSRLAQAGSGAVSGTARVPLGYTGAMRPQALLDQPLAGARIELADLTGRPLGDVPAVVTAADGTFAFARVPAGLTLLVIGHIQTPTGEPAQLRALVRTQDGGTSVNLTLASTLLTAGLLASEAAEGAWTQSAFESAANLIASVIDLEVLPDWADTEAIEAEIAGLQALHCPIRQALAELADGAVPTVACTPKATPTPRPRFGGGSSGGGGAPRPAATASPGSLAADIIVTDGPRIAVTPTPTP